MDDKNIKMVLYVTCASIIFLMTELFFLIGYYKYIDYKIKFMAFNNHYEQRTVIIKHGNDPENPEADVDESVHSFWVKYKK